MEWYIKILPKYKIGMFSKWSWDNQSHNKNYISLEFIPSPKHEGYVRVNYGEHEYRYIVYENIPQFGNREAQFKTIKEAVDFIATIKELEEK